ncbi:iron uptake transporter deferrochelatase/peroxidase subunit [Priestia megaterium]|uniref:iron uptake transporter deferrochelatase/peroxidase subunit n=1 Tax=Priestia megaterium TaxID=1404 RepID=UPI000BF356F5|nr:iron uptake transporter deferrochelatase/peroxidase subunit [Priestia megaterium]PFK63336.1 deferrochelatase/peroxidase EfeB [Priestia megaterium]
MTEEKKNGYTRREMLKVSAVAGAGIAIGASGLGTVLSIGKTLSPAKETAATSKADDTIPFYAKHQAGIITPQQEFIYLGSFNLTTSSKDQVIALLKDWTKLSDVLTRGAIRSSTDNKLLPPNDTGEAIDLSPAKLTATFGFGSSFFKVNGVDRFGISDKQPASLKDIPHMPHDNLDKKASGGDICIQVCADNEQVAFHALRQFIKASTGTASVHWIQKGFIASEGGKTPRNLFGFKDGTANAAPTNEAFHKNYIWTKENEPSWMNGGTYMCYRKIRMFLEVWDRTSLQDQEDTFGRKKDTGAPYGRKKESDSVNMQKQPVNSHVRLAKQAAQPILRRGYSYVDGMDEATGNVDAGLIFISFQKNPEKQILPMLKVLGNQDALNEYISHIGSAMFACPKGVSQGSYIGKDIFEA